MTRSIRSCFLPCMLLLVATAAPAAAQDAITDEAPAIAAIEDAGGTVRQIAQSTDEREVSFHPGGHSAGDELLPHVANVAEVTRLDLRQSQVTDAGLVHIGGMTGLERLHLEQTCITDAGLAHLAGLTNLKYLNLYGTQVSDAGLPQLAGLENLEKIYLWQTEVTDEGAIALTELLPNVQVLLGADVRPTVLADPPSTVLATGRTVRVRLEGVERILSLTEVQIVEPVTGVQLQVGGAANQSSVAYGGAPQRASDGNTNPSFSSGSVTHSETEPNPWWAVDLGGDKEIGLIKIYNRGDCCGDRLIGAIVEVLDSSDEVVWSATIDEAATGSLHEFQTAAEVEEETEAEVETDAEAVVETEAETEAETDAESVTEAEAEAEPEAEPETEAEVEAETEAEAEAEIEAETEAAADAEAETKAETEAK